MVNFGVRFDLWRLISDVLEDLGGGLKGEIISGSTFFELTHISREIVRHFQFVLLIIYNLIRNFERNT